MLPGLFFVAVHLLRARNPFGKCEAVCKLPGGWKGRMDRSREPRWIGEPEAGWVRSVVELHRAGPE